MPFFSRIGTSSLGADLVEEVANPIVSVDEVSILRAACGMIAKNIDGLHAQRATDFFRNTQTNKHRHLKIPWLHDSVFPVQSRRERGDPRPACSH